MKYSSLRKGDTVKSDFYSTQQHIKRRIINKVKDNSCGSGYRVDLSDGGVCKCCHQPIGKPIVGVDASYITEIL